ncbi:methyltransferase-like protein 27 isoform X3 [Gadus macrocephalus]|uniref:methyltransferase-like protein 27 isoform X3 n=1 Tax=Gadus macrocephalus TaxID=80720 RepID=UPI0028CB9310|nr:methyltransferase-like protein 27 isoform X3 [Gadus macrocephalus]
MSSETRTLDNVKDVILSAHMNLSPAEKVEFYNTWSENYDKDVSLLDYRAPLLAADLVSAHFPGERGAAWVLDVACGTGLVAAEMKKHGFGRLVGLDGSKGMLQLAKNTGLYEDVRQCMLGEDQLPVTWGGLVCMTTRSNRDNVLYKACLEQQLKLMEDEGLWSRVTATEVEEWERAVSVDEVGYIGGCVYIYRVSDVKP